MLNQAVKRNSRRFPEDFMFRLNQQETSELVTNCDRFNSLKHSSSFPYAFTEHGILMLSSVLNSTKAIEVNIQIMRTFTKLREMMVLHKDLREKIEAMELKYDYQFQEVFAAIRKILYPPRPRKSKIPFGFQIPVNGPKIKLILRKGVALKQVS
jgi:hypothetical protein